MTTISQFIDRITEIAYAIAPFLKAERLPRTARKIDELLEIKHPVIDFILENLDTKKTPLYFLHRKELTKKNHIRKQDFLALYEYLKRHPPEPEPEEPEPEEPEPEEPEPEEPEPEYPIIRCYRDTLTNEETGNTYIGINLYFVALPSHLDFIEDDMECIRDVFKFAIARWTPELLYNESDISECDAPDSDVSNLKKGFVFEVADDMEGDWHYYGVWREKDNDRDWWKLKIYAEFPITAVTMLLKQAGL
jgi:hypothetical protein